MLGIAGEIQTVFEEAGLNSTLKSIIEIVSKLLKERSKSESASTKKKKSAKSSAKKKTRAKKSTRPAAKSTKAKKAAKKKSS
jgi:hypothetical protein